MREMKDYLKELKKLKADFKRDKLTGSYCSIFNEYSMEIHPDYDGGGIYWEIYKNNLWIGGDGGKGTTMRSCKEDWLWRIKNNNFNI